ncbi:hypothetical protein glysoja_040841, partial [Glycine soja]
SPYFIHPSDGPSSVSITPVLDGTNYQSWSRTFHMTLISRNKMAFLLGTIPVPSITEPTLYSAWERCNTLIMSWLLNSLSPFIAQSVIFLECAADIWNDLRERNRSVSDFYTALKILWEELDNYRPFVIYSCEAKKYHQRDFVIRFLKGLDERFSVVRSQILLMDPLPMVNRVFSMVVQHECQLSVVPPSSDEPNSFVNASNGFGKGRGVSGSSSTHKNASNKRCSYCHRTGHTIDVCWGKHDYPPAQYQSLMALIQQPISASDAMGNILVQPNNANLIQVPFNERNDSDPNGISFIFSSITQFTHNTSSATCKHSVPWIIDSGATNHIASSLKCFSSYSKINPIQINLPNKSIVTAYISGTIIFSPNFILHNVLFVPEFHFNLLSISKLLKTRKFTLIFDDLYCTIQDKHSLQMIGHLSGNRLNMLHEQFPFIPSHVNENCDICHFAKQRKLSYNLSTSRALKIFD